MASDMVDCCPEKLLESQSDHVDMVWNINTFDDYWIISIPKPKS